jgi:biotin operon repressor
MSNDPSNGGTHLDNLISRRKAAEARDAAARDVDARRERIWESRLVRPVTNFAPGWTDAWEGFAAALRSGSLSGAAAGFAAIDRRLAELQRVWEGWLEARKSWFRETAEPWNRLYAEGARFSWISPRHEPDWLRVRAHTAPSGPAPIPARVAAWVAAYVPDHWCERLEYQAPLEAVFLFGMLGGAGLVADGVERRLSELTQRTQLADVAPVLAAFILPAPEILGRLVGGAHRPKTRHLIDSILSLSSGGLGEKFGDWLGGELRRLRGEPACADQPRPAPILTVAEEEFVQALREAKVAQAGPDLAGRIGKSEVATRQTAKSLKAKGVVRRVRGEGYSLTEWGGASAPLP